MKTQHTLRDNWHDIVYDRRYVSIVMGDMEKDQGHRTLLAHRPQAVRQLLAGRRRRQALHHALPHHQAGQRLFAHGGATGNGTQEPDSRAHAVARSSGGGRCTLRERETDPLGRLALHAFKLCFYPLTGERMEFETPYPAPFKNLMLKIKAIYDKKPDF